MSQTLPASGLLTSWKEIASFMGKGVRTVQRWEATLGLPVIRPADGHAGIVMARPSDLEAWVRKGRQRSSVNADGWQRKNAEVRATFGESVRKLHRNNTEIRTLYDQMMIAGQTLQQEIDRMRFLCRRFQALGDLAPGEANPSDESQAN
jgi:hypothetical protein